MAKALEERFSYFYWSTFPQSGARLLLTTLQNLFPPLWWKIGCVQSLTPLNYCVLRLAYQQWQSLTLLCLLSHIVLIRHAFLLLPHSNVALSALSPVSFQTALERAKNCDSIYASGVSFQCQNQMLLNTLSYRLNRILQVFFSHITNLILLPWFT